MKLRRALRGPLAHRLQQRVAHRGLMGDDENTGRIRHRLTSGRECAIWYESVSHPGPGGRKGWRISGTWPTSATRRPRPSPTGSDPAPPAPRRRPRAPARSAPRSPDARARSSDGRPIATPWWISTSLPQSTTPWVARCTASGPAADPVAGSSGTPSAGDEVARVHAPVADRVAVDPRDGRAQPARRDRAPARRPRRRRAAARRRAGGRCDRRPPAPRSARPRARAAARPRPSQACATGIGWAISPNTISSPRARARPGRDPRRCAASPRPRRSGRRPRSAEPSTGCPAKGSSAAGVKIRARASASPSPASRNTVSERLSSRAVRCIVASEMPLASRNTASGLPCSGRRVNTSRTT